MMKEIAALVSAAVAAASDPGVAIGAIGGWFGYWLWARWREKGGSSTDERNVDKPGQTVTEFETKGRRAPGPEEVLPHRVATEIVVPVLRGLEPIVNEFSKKGIGCTEMGSWRGAKSDGSEWRDSLSPYAHFAPKRHGPSTVVEVNIELLIKRNRYPAKSAPLAWRGDFGSRNYKIVGTWRRGPRNIVRLTVDEVDPIPAQNITSLLQLMEDDLHHAIESWEGPENEE